MKQHLQLIGLALLALTAIIVIPALAGKEPTQRTCPATSPNQERLAYATYHHDGRLTCTYIVHEVGRAKRELTMGVPEK